MYLCIFFILDPCILYTNVYSSNSSNYQRELLTPSLYKKNLSYEKYASRFRNYTLFKCQIEF